MEAQRPVEISEWANTCYLVMKELMVRLGRKNLLWPEDFKSHSGYINYRFNNKETPKLNNWFNMINNFRELELVTCEEVRRGYISVSFTEIIPIVKIKKKVNNSAKKNNRCLQGDKIGHDNDNEFRYSMKDYDVQKWFHRTIKTIFSLKTAKEIIPLADKLITASVKTNQRKYLRLKFINEFIAFCKDYCAKANSNDYNLFTGILGLKSFANRYMKISIANPSNDDLKIIRKYLIDLYVLLYCFQVLIDPPPTFIIDPPPTFIFGPEGIDKIEELKSLIISLFNKPRQVVVNLSIPSVEDKWVSLVKIKVPAYVPILAIQRSNGKITISIDGVEMVSVPVNNGCAPKPVVRYEGETSVQDGVEIHIGELFVLQSILQL